MIFVIRHGQHGTRAWNVWRNMRRRCNDPNTINYKRYGGRGIKVCDRWKSFENFFSDMGECPEGLTLDRVDNDKNYAPDNCRWATHKEQSRNQSTTRLLTFEDETRCLEDWANLVGLDPTTLARRLKKAPIEKVLISRWYNGRGWVTETKPSRKKMSAFSNGSGT